MILGTNLVGRTARTWKGEELEIVAVSYANNGLVLWLLHEDGGIRGMAATSGNVTIVPHPKQERPPALPLPSR